MVRPQQVYVWRTHVEAWRRSHWWAKFWSWLEEAEQRRHQRFATQQLQDRYLFSHALVRMALSRLTGHHPAVWRYRKNPWGRPLIEEPAEWKGLFFSLSHSGDWAGCAAALRQEVGYDLQRMASAETARRVSHRFFTREEANAIANLAPEAAAEVFTRLWTRKEAYMKACGRGLSLPLRAAIPDRTWRIWSDRYHEGWETTMVRAAPNENWRLIRCELTPHDASLSW